jgi:hypothetical protein
MTTTTAGAPGAGATTAADAATQASQTATSGAGGAPAGDQAAVDAAAQAAAAAEATKTPEQKAADVAAAQATADAAAAEAAKKAGVPDKYELKLPDNAGVDAAIVEKTAAKARELGLSQDNAQKTLEFVAQEAAAEVTARLAAYAPPSDANPTGGEKWREQDETWRAASLADKDLGNGKPEQLQAVVGLATKVVAKFGDADLTGFFEKSGLGSNPATLRFLSRIGKAMSEGSLVIAETPTVADNSEEAVAARRYNHPTSKAKK